MPSEDPLIEFTKLLKHLAEAVRQAVQASVGKKWKDAYLDVRSPPEGGSRTMKLRVNVSTKKVASVKTTADIDSTILRLFHLKDAAFTPRWYGLKLLVTHSGACEATYNYDPECEADEAFWED